MYTSKSTALVTHLLETELSICHKNNPQELYFAGVVLRGSPQIQHLRGKSIMLQRRRFLQLSSGAITLRQGESLFTKTELLGDSPTPKFWFGDAVYQEEICDDELDRDNFGKPLRDYGKIIGLFFSSGSRFYPPGWNYFISWQWVGGEATTNNDWDSAVHESDLKRSEFLVPPMRCH